MIKRRPDGDGEAEVEVEEREGDDGESKRAGVGRRSLSAARRPASLRPGAVLGVGVAGVRP